METALLIMLREGFEAALIVAIVLAYLRRIERWDARRDVWLGVAGAVVAAIAAGVVIHLMIGSLEGAARQRVFAAVSIAAAGVITWMIFWMRRQSRHLKGELERKTQAVLDSGSGMHRGLIALAFFAVVREGVEAALFLVATATGSSGWSVVVGALLGTGAACGLAYLVYAGGRRIPMRAFFTVTGLVLIVFAAGLLSRAVMLLQSVGDLGSWNLNGVYDLRSVPWLTQSSEIGKFLAALFGWDPRPSIEQVLLWLVYAVPVAVLFLRPARPANPRATISGG